MNKANYQGNVDWKLFERKKTLIRNIRYNRCPVCNSDVEILYPLTFVINDKTFRKVITISKENGAKFSLIKREYIHYPMNFRQDDITLEMINGMANHVSVDVCRRCIDKIGRRHKFNKEEEKKKFISKEV